MAWSLSAALMGTFWCSGTELNRGFRRVEAACCPFYYPGRWSGAAELHCDELLIRRPCSCYISALWCPSGDLNAYWSSF